MKEIDGQLYGYSYELDKTSEEDLTTCYAVDTGTIFIAFGGVWYEQPGSKWAAGGGGGGLPEVSADDNGDVLTVVEGAWGKAAPSGGGGALIVNITGEDYIYTMDKTAKEVYDAFLSGPVVVSEVQGGDAKASGGDAKPAGGDAGASGGGTTYNHYPIQEIQKDDLGYSFFVGIRAPFLASADDDYPISDDT